VFYPVDLYPVSKERSNGKTVEVCPTQLLDFSGEILANLYLFRIALCIGCGARGGVG
jgi:ferredoxin